MVNFRSIDKRYVQTYIVCCLFILSIGLNNAYSVFIVPLADALNVGRGTVTLASTISDLICSTLSPVLIVLLNKVKLNRLLLVSTLAFAILTALTGIFPNVVTFYIINILKGFVFIVFGVNVIVIVLGNWFEKGRETLIGTALAFTGMAGAFFSQVFDCTLKNNGFRFTFIIYAVLAFIIALPAIIFLKYRPEEAGLTILKDSEKEEAGDTVSDSGKTTMSLNRQYRLSDPVFIGICAVFFIMVTLTNVSAHFPGYADTIGYGHLGASMVSYMMIGSILFKSGMGIVMDKFGPKSGFPISISIVFISMTMILLGRGNILLIGSFLFGAIFSTLINLNPLIRYCFGDKQYPEVFAKVMVVSAISNLGGPIAGYIYDFTGSYASSLYASCFLCIVALIVYFITIRIAEKQRS